MMKGLKYFPNAYVKFKGYFEMQYTKGSCLNIWIWVGLISMK